MNKHSSKRLLCLFMTLAMVFSMVPGMTAMAATPVLEGTEREEVPQGVYETSGDTVEVPLGEEVSRPAVSIDDVAVPEAGMFAAPAGSELHVANGRGNDATGDGSEGNPYLTIGGALAAAEDAGMRSVAIVLDTNVESSSELVFDTDMDVVVKSNGATRKIVYTGSRPIGDESGFIKVVRGSVAFDDVILSGAEVDSVNGNNNRVVYVSDGGSITLNGVTVTKGLVKTGGTYGGGSAIYVADGGSATVSGSSVIRNNYTTGGGTIYVADGGTVSLEDNTQVTGNTSKVGGGVYAAAQTGETGGLFLSGSVSIEGNTSMDGKGAGMYVEYGAKASVRDDVVVYGNKTGNKQDNVFLADGPVEGQVATLDITGATAAAKLGISCETEYAYRLVSLPRDYDIVSTWNGDEKGWSDDCGAWDIRYMVYDGQPGLYLCYKSVDAVFRGVDTLTGLAARDINGEDADYLNGGMPAVTRSGDVLTAESIVLKNGSDYVVILTVDPGEYRLPTKDVVSVKVDGASVEFGYDNQGDPEGGTLVLTVPAAAIEDAVDEVEFIIAAEKLYDLKVVMNGPLYALSGSGIVDGRFSETVLDLSESGKTGTTARYKVLQGGNAPGMDVYVVLYRADGTQVESKAVDAEGVAEFTGLDETMNYYIVLNYQKDYKVISRDVLDLALSTLDGQTLSADCGNTTGTVAYDWSAGKASVSGVTTDGSVTFSVDQAKEALTFVANEENARGDGLAASTVAVVDPLTKEMPKGTNTYGELASASLVGYTFDGWYTRPVGGDRVEPNTAYKTGDSATVLYAHWTPRDDTAYGIRHWVEYAEGGENRRYDGTSIKTVGGTTYYLYETTSENDGMSDTAIDLSGHDLTEAEMTEAECSWWTRNGFTSRFPANAVVAADGSSVFDIVYDRNAYPVAFVNKGQEGSTATVPAEWKEIPDGSAKFGDDYGKLPQPTLPGYEFAGWYDETKDGEAGLVTPSTIHKDTDGVELTAHWNARSDTKWAIKVVTEDIAQYQDGEWYKPGTYSESKTVYVDDGGNLLTGVTDTQATKSVGDIAALFVEGFTFKGYSDKFDANGQGVTVSDGGFTVYVKATDASTDDGHGSYNDKFDGGIVYLYYTRDTVKAQFVDGQGKTTEEEIIYGGDFTGKLPPEPGKDGYDFDHWVDPKDPSKEITEDTPADQYVLDGETIVVEPAWTARQYNLTYVPGQRGKYVKAEGAGEATLSHTVAGGYVDPTLVTYDRPFGAMPKAAKVGYVFDGWQVEGKDGFVTSETNVDVTNVVISNAPVYDYEATRPLYARYTPHVYTLVFDAGRSSVTGEEGSVEPAELQVTYDAAVGILPTPVLRGYRFVDWVLADGTNTPVRGGMTWTKPYANGTRIPVKAVWVPENYRYTFNLNDQVGSTRGQLVDTTVDYVEETFDSVYDKVFAVEAIRPGYDFKGWSLLPDGNVLTAEDLVALSENRTLYAIWEPKLYNVRLVMKGGAIADLTDNSDLTTYDPTAVYDVESDTWTIKVAFDSTYGELPVPVKADCTYNGYLADAPGWPAKEGYGVTIHDQVITALPQYIDFEDKDGITLVAVLEPWFTFDPDGGVFVPDGGTDPVKKLQSDIEALPSVEKDGYSHEGWTGEDGSVKTLEDVKSAQEPETLKPVFVAKLTMDANGGTVDGEAVKTVSMSSLTVLPTPVREGYTFDGWYLDKAGEQKFDFGEMKARNEPATIIARWDMNVVFDANGGKVEDKDSVEKAIDGLKELPAATRSGRYSFQGWFTEKTGGEKVELDAVKAFNEVRTLYAQWRYLGGSGGGGGSYTPPKPIEDPVTPLSGLDLLTKDHVAYVAGFPDGTVRPLDDISRAEVAMIFYRLLTDEARAMYKTPVHDFADVDDWGWSAVAIGTLQKAGILKGRGNGMFDPEAKITRAEFAAICARFDDLDMTGEKFSDVPESHWAYAEITSAAAKGWVKGRGNGTFGPDDNLTRAEAMTLINRVLNRATTSQELELKTDNPGFVKAWPDNDADAWYYVAVQEATNNHDKELSLTKDGKLSKETWTHVLETKVANQ